VAGERRSRREAARARAEARREAAREARNLREARRNRRPHLEAYDPSHRYAPPRASRGYGEWVYPDAPVRSRTFVERRRYYSDSAPRGYFVRRPGPGGVLGWLSGD
jgi:hypothetical protein